MALTDATLTAVGTFLSGLLTHISLHSADPGSNGANEIGTRLSVAWNVDTDGDLTLTAVRDFSGLAPNQPVAAVGLWNAPTSGIFRGAYLLSGDTTANSAGEFEVSGITINGIAT